MTALEPIKDLADRLLEIPQVDCPVTHRFAPGVYIREMAAPADTFMIGNEHATEHMNILVSGVLRIIHGTAVREIHAPCFFVSGAHTMKVAYAVEDVVFVTIHPTDETDVEVLEKLLFIKTAARIEYEQAQKLIKCPPSPLA